MSNGRVDLRDLDIEQFKRDADGFLGRFAFLPATVVEHRKIPVIGTVEDAVMLEDRLVYIPNDAGEDDYDDHYVIGDNLEQHVAEPIARLLNNALAIGRMLEPE